MAKEKVKKPEEVKAEPVAQVVEEAPEPVLQADSIDARVAQIVSLFSEINQVEGVPFDKDNPKHRLIAAWMVGRGGWLRK